MCHWVCVVIADAETDLYDGDYWYFEDYGIPPKYHLKGDKMWRHITFQFDEDTDTMRFFLDGALGIEGPSLIPVSEMDIDEGKELYVNGQADFLKNNSFLFEKALVFLCSHLQAVYTCSSHCKCLILTITWGSETEDGNFWGALSLADVRMYVHGTDGPLSLEEISMIADVGAAERLGSSFKCLPSDSMQLSDQVWKDGQDHDCQASYLNE